jgi:hypothetical protein
LLDRLVSEHLETAAEAVRAEGWTWVDILPKLDYAEVGKFGSVEPKRQKLSGEDSEALDKLNAKLDALIEPENADDDSDAPTLLSRAPSVMLGSSASKPRSKRSSKGVWSGPRRQWRSPERSSA